MVNVILVVVFTGRDKGKCGQGFAGGEKPALGGDVAGGFEDDVLAVAGASGGEIEALVVVLKNQHVGGVGRAEGVAPELELALLLFVFDGVEKGGIDHPIDEDLSMGAPVVGGPGDGANALDLFR